MRRALKALDHPAMRLPRALQPASLVDTPDKPALEVVRETARSTGEPRRPKR